MGIIVNPRGAGGAGKTELVRRLLAELQTTSGGRLEPLLSRGRLQPIGYQVHPSGGRSPVVVIGRYERKSGGCDTVTLRDGGIDEIVRLADEHAASGARVLLEGALLSEEHRRSADLARLHRLCVLRLDTPSDACVRNLVSRRRARRDTWDAIRRTVELRRASVANACAHLETAGAIVAHMPFEPALDRARELLGIGPSGAQGAAPL